MEGGVVDLAGVFGRPDKDLIVVRPLCRRAGRAVSILGQYVLQPLTPRSEAGAARERSPTREIFFLALF